MVVQTNIHQNFNIMAIVIDVNPKVQLPNKLALQVQVSRSGDQSVILPSKYLNRTPNLSIKVEKTERNDLPKLRVEGSGFPTADLAVKVPAVLKPVFSGLQITLQITEELSTVALPLRVFLQREARLDDVFAVRVDGVKDLPQLIIKQGKKVLFKHWIPLAKDVVKKTVAKGVQDFILDKNGKCYLLYSAFAADLSGAVCLLKDLPTQLPEYTGTFTVKKEILFTRFAHSRPIRIGDAGDWDGMVAHPDGFVGVSCTKDEKRQIWLNGVYLIHQGAFNRLLSAPDGSIYLLNDGVLEKITIE